LVKGFQAFHVCLKMRNSFGIHNAESKQIEFGAAVHRAFDELQAVNMTFDWSVAPWMLKGGEHGRVAVEMGRRSGQARRTKDLLAQGAG
jgi:ABC-type polar amino acid transport system ATPase subunit